MSEVHGANCRVAMASVLRGCESLLEPRGSALREVTSSYASALGQDLAREHVPASSGLVVSESGVSGLSGIGWHGR